MRNAPRPRTTLPLTYVNRKGETVQIEVSGHARTRFRERWQSAFPTLPLPDDFELELRTWFAKSRRTEPTSRKYQTRLRRYGKDTLYFYAHPFMFVVQSAMLRTVELASRETRPLNNVHRLNRGAQPANTQSAQEPMVSGISTPSADFDDVLSMVAESVAEPVIDVAPNGGETARNRRGISNGNHADLTSSLPFSFQNTPRSYRLLGGATDEDRRPKFIGLGTYPVDGTNGDARLLPAIPEFLPEIRERFQKKRPGWILLAIYATLGKHGDQIRIYDEVQ